MPVYQSPDLRFRDVVGRLKVSESQNVYDADFEYGPQSLRWETLTAGGGAVAHQPGAGGVRMAVDTANGSLAIRQSRPYFRYQPGKTMFMATAVVFGSAEADNVQRVGFFDDSNGVFFEQATPTPGNPSGIFAVIRSDSAGLPVDTRFDLAAWNGDQEVVQTLNWSRIQMLYIEYAWYGGGAIRWGCVLDGEPRILHQVGVGNGLLNNANRTAPWARTGNLPVRYETRNTGAPAQANALTHYGVSVIVEGKNDDQRGFTYPYGMNPASPRRAVPSNSSRVPVLSVRGRAMGVSEFTQASAACTAGTTSSLTAGAATWTVNQWVGRGLTYTVAGVLYAARVISNTATVLTIADIVTGGAVAVAPAAGQNYSIGLINRGQFLPRRLLVSSSALCVVELIASSAQSPVILTAPAFQALSALGSANSFAERDLLASALTGGEVVFGFTAPAGGSGLLDLQIDQLFPLVNNIRGNQFDTLSVVVSTPNTNADVGAHLICQEAMS